MELVSKAIVERQETVAGGQAKNISDSIMGLIGNTPIIKLNNLFEGKRAFGKLEYYNPTRSMKDRTAWYIIDKAERDGKLKKGDVIIESSSGNFGLAISFIGRMKGYRVVCVVDPRISDYFLKMYSILETDIVMVDDIYNGSYQFARIEKANQINAANKNSFRPDQYDNLDNRDAHYHTTGKEIVEQMRDVGLDYLVIGVSTGGTISGCASRVKEYFPKCKIVAVDAIGSILFGGEPKSRFMTGLGSNYIPKNLDYDLCDDFLCVSDDDAFRMVSRLLHDELIFSGPSSGAVAFAMKRIIELEVDKDPVVLGIFPDSGDRYMSSAYDPEWLKKNFRRDN